MMVTTMMMISLANKYHSSTRILDTRVHPCVGQIEVIRVDEHLHFHQHLLIVQY